LLVGLLVGLILVALYLTVLDYLRNW